MTSGERGGGGLRELLSPRGAALGAALLLALLTMSYDAPAVLLALLAVPALVLLLVRPRAATVITLFLLYANVPVLAARLYGVPMLVAASAALLLGLPLAHHLILRREPIVLDRTFGFMMLFLVAMAASATLARAPEIAAARMGFYVLEGVVLYWLVVNVVRDLPGLRRVMWTLLAAGALLSALGVWQAVADTYGRQFGGLAHREMEVRAVDELGEPIDVRISKRAQGPVDDANRFAQILIVLLPMALFAYRTSRKLALRLAAGACGVLVLAGVLLTYSRGAFLVLVLLVCAAVWVRWIRPLPVAAGALAVLLALPHIAPTYHERIASIATAPQLLENRFEARTDGAIRGRTTEMLSALHVFMDHPVLGVGPGNYTPVYSVEYQNRPEVSFRNLQRPRRAHSLYLEMAAEMGIVGLAVFLTMVGLLVRDLWRARPRGEVDELAHLALALTFGLLGYLGTAVFLHLSFERYFWLLLALASVGVHVVHSVRRTAPGVAAAGSPAPPAPRLRTPLWTDWLPAPAAAMSGALAAAQTRGSGDAWSAAPASGRVRLKGARAADLPPAPQRASSPRRRLRELAAAATALPSALTRASIDGLRARILGVRVWLRGLPHAARNALASLLERLRTRYVHKMLDAVLTSSVLPPETASLRRVVLPLRQAHFKRVQAAMLWFETLWPALALRIRDLLIQDELLPFDVYFDPRPFAHGWNSTVFRLRPRHRTMADSGEAVLKVFRSSLGRSPSWLATYARDARARYQRLTSWYGTDMVPPTHFLLLQAPLLGTTAAASLQPRLPGRPKDLFALSDDELLCLLDRHPALCAQFCRFVARTADAVRSGISPDLLGRRNVLVVDMEDGPRLRIVDTGLKDLVQLTRARPNAVHEIRIRVARLERIHGLVQQRGRSRWSVVKAATSRTWSHRGSFHSPAGPVPPASRLVVLTYHGVLDPAESSAHNASVVSATAAAFEWQMRRLARDCRVVSMHDVIEAFRAGRTLPQRAVLITFDDAYRDFGEVAWPVLRRLGLPAALFVPTAYPDNPDLRFWWDRLAAAFARAEPRRLSVLLGGSTIVYWPEGWRRALRDVQSRIKSLPHAQAMATVADMLSRLGEPPAPARSPVLGWDELRELAREGVALCPHTRTHPALTRIPIAEARAEVRGSLEDLTSEIGSVHPAFAYPFGDHDSMVVEMLRQEGVVAAFSTREGHNEVPGADPLRLHRTNVAPTGAHLLPLRLLAAGERLDRWRDSHRRTSDDGVSLPCPPRTVTGAAPARDLPRPQHQPVVAYMMSRFPKLTETFVLYEIAALEALGVPVEVYPLLRQRQSVSHPEADAWVRRAHFHPFISSDILRAQLHFLKRDPLRYAGVLLEVMRRTWGSRNFFIGSLAIFPKAVRFAYEMEERGVSHIHAHFANHPTAAAFIIHRLTGIPYSFTAHGSDLHVDRRMLDRKVEAAAFAVTVSDYNREVIVEECGETARAKVHVVRCGVDPEVFAAASDARGGRSETLAFSCVASFEEVKGHTHLVEACRILRDRGVRFRCHLVGTGPLRQRIESAVARAGLTGQVIFHGGLPRPEVARLMALMDASVLASQPTRQGKREGIPVALMEAMCAGLPVVASDLSGIPELVRDGETGLLVPPADPIALANALQRLADDPELRARLGLAAQVKVRADFDLRKNAAKLLGLLLGAPGEATAAGDQATTGDEPAAGDGVTAGAAAPAPPRHVTRPAGQPHART